MGAVAADEAMVCEAVGMIVGRAMPRAMPMTVTVMSLTLTMIMLMSLLLCRKK